MVNANVVTLFNAANQNVGTFSTIQDAVNAAANGYTVVASAGTYQEQVTVHGLTNLTIEGAGAGQTIIQSPDYTNLVSNIQNPNEFHTFTDALVGVDNGGSITVKNLTVDGNNQGIVYAVGPNGGGDLVGIEAVDSSVTVDNVHVTNVWDFEPGTGLQGGQGNKAIIVNDTNGSVQTATVQNSTIDNFQKSGIQTQGTGLTVNINNNTVTGIGTGQSTGIAQNLIVVEKGATGSITDNIVSGIPDTGGTAILVELASGVTASGNSVTGIGGTLNSNGIYFYGSDAGVAQNNTIDNIGFALADDGSLALFTTALVQDHNTFSGDLPNYYFFAGPTSTIAWTITGTGGPDDLEGGANNDVFLLAGGAANGNIFVGNGGTDAVSGYSAGYQAVIQGGQWVVTNGVLTDTLTSIEKIVIGGTTFDLVDQLGANTGGFQSVQAAADAAQAGDVILANAGTSPVSVNVTVDNLTFEPSQTYTGITLTLAGSVHTVTLADYAAGQGTPVTVVANNLGDRIVGNDAADQFTAGTGADTFVVLNLGTTIDAFGHGDAIDLPGLGFMTGATATYDTTSHVLTVTSNSVSDTLTLTNPAGTTFEALDDGTAKTKVVVNEPPVASNGSASGNENTVISGAVVATDTYNDPLTYALVGANGGAQHGTVALNAAGTFTYTPAHDFNGSDSFSFEANDGVFNSNVATESLTVQQIDMPPSNTVPGAQTIQANTATAIAGISVSDVDAGAGIETTTLSVAHGTLTIASDGGASVSGSGSGTVTLNGTIAQLDTTLGAANNVLYQPASGFSGTDTLTVTTNDNGHTGAGGPLSATSQVTLNIAQASPSLDLPPSNTVPGAETIQANTATAIAGISVSDADAGAGIETTTLSVAHGTLTIASDGGASVAGSGSGTVTLNGTIAQLDTTLGAANNLLYHGAHDFFGTDTLTVSTNDNGHTGTGGPLTATNQVTLNVGPLLSGTSGNDTFTAMSGNERIDGHGGVDTIGFNFKLTDAQISFVGNEVIVDGPNASSHTVLTGFDVYQFTDGTVTENTGNPLVDNLFYDSQYHDVWAAHVDPTQHYLAFGWLEGRDPDAFFSTSTYLSKNTDVKAAGVNPLLHFEQFGWKEGRDPSIDFDTNAYLKANPDVKAAGVDPLAQFLANGEAEGRQPIAPTSLLAPNGFDYVYYLQHDPDVAAAHVDPLAQFEANGWKEGRNPNALFDVKGYLNAYADVKAAGVDPLDQYHQFGWMEGRNPSPFFDTNAYLKAYPDVAAAHIDPLLHYLAFGINEGRQAFATGHF